MRMLSWCSAISGEKTERESKWRNRSCFDYCTDHAGKKMTKNMSITAGLTMLFEEIVVVCISPGIDPIWNAAACIFPNVKAPATCQWQHERLSFAQNIWKSTSVYLCQKTVGFTSEDKWYITGSKVKRLSLKCIWAHLKEMIIFQEHTVPSNSITWWHPIININHLTKICRWSMENNRNVALTSSWPRTCH